MIRHLLLALCVWLFAAAAAAVDVNEPFDDPVLNERYQALIRESRCPKCQNETIADSNAPIAADLRRQVHQRVAAGQSEEQIVQFLYSRYGDFVLYRPQVKPSTWALWGGPFLFLAIGGLVFWRILSRRSGQPIEDDLAEDELAPDEDPAT